MRRIINSRRRFHRDVLAHVQLREAAPLQAGGDLGRRRRRRAPRQAGRGQAARPAGGGDAEAAGGDNEGAPGTAFNTFLILPLQVSLSTLDYVLF